MNNSVQCLTAAEIDDVSGGGEGYDAGRRAGQAVGRAFNELTAAVGDAWDSLWD